MPISALHALLLFFLFSVVFSLAYIALKLVRDSRKRRIEKMSDETGDPHACLPGTFSPLPVVRSKEFEIGGSTHAILIFQGMYCSTCGRELCCEACGRTPGYGAMLVSGEAEHWTRCCAPPKWALRYGGKTLAPEDRPKPTADDDEEERLRWN